MGSSQSSAPGNCCAAVRSHSVDRLLLWIAISGVAVFAFDGCRAGPWETPAQARHEFAQRIAASLDNQESNLYVANPYAYGVKPSNNGGGARRSRPGY